MSTTQATPTKPKKNPNGFFDPYADVDEWHKTRTTIDVADEAIAALRSVYPKKGVIQTTINILLEKLRQELTRCMMHSYDPEKYEIGLAQCQIRLGGFNYDTHDTKRNKPRSRP